MKEKGEMLLMLETSEQKKVTHVICSTIRDRSLWRGVETSTFALKGKETFLNSSSQFLNRYLYCTLKCH